jgi:hypothetical protein
MIEESPQRIARVFPRKTKATPTDPLVFTDAPGLFPPEVDSVHVSVTFSWDMPRAESLAQSWGVLGVPVSLGGPATGEAGGAFVPGRYLKEGYVITSRGCPNRCWFCSVWQREGQQVRELPVRDGFNVLDDNLLACSEAHVREVFAMLTRQPQRARFTGGLEAARLQPWHIDLLADLRPETMFFAYDTADDFEPLQRAAGLLRAAGFTAHHLRCYVLCGWRGDTVGAAEQRLRAVCDLGMDPMAMLFQTGSRERDPEWVRFTKLWSRPASIHAMMKVKP